MDGTSCSELPPEILQRVVSFLPLVSLFRCRLVCKQWNAWISELHPQTPAQRTEILIVSNHDEHMWYALDTNINKWYKIDSRVFTFIEPYIGGPFVSYASDNGLVLAGYIDTDGEFGLFVCNPVSRIHFGAIPDSGLEPCLHDIVVDDSKRTYKVYWLTVPDEFGTGEKRTVHVYSSIDMRWTLVCTVPDLSDSCFFSIQEMVTSEEFVHLLVILETVPAELKFYSVLSYSMIQKTWVHHGGSDIPLLLREDTRIAHLFKIRAQLFLVGETIDMDDFRTSILVWKVSFGRNETCNEIAEMPLSIFRPLRTLDPLTVCGCSDRIFFMFHNSTTLTSYCLLNNSWHSHHDKLTSAPATLPEFERCALFEKFMSLTTLD